MDPCTIIVIDSEGNESNESVANDHEFEALIDDYGVRCLVTNDSSKTKIRGFGSLMHGGMYTLGPPIRQQQQQQQQQQQLQLQSNIMEEIKYVVDYVRTQKTDSQTLILSEPMTERFNNTMCKFNFKKDAAEWLDKPASFDPPKQAHTWLPSEEDSPENREAYMAYLRNPDNFKLPPDTRLFEGSLEKDLLSVKFLGFGNVKTSGNVDVILASSRHQSTATIKQHILVGIELKKDTNTHHSRIERQVILQHLAASYLNADTGILTLMTDLVNRWHFFWFAEGKRLMRYEATGPEAMFLIRHSQDEELQTSTPNSFLNRASWDDLFSSQLGSITEVKLFGEGDGEGEDREQRSDWNGGGKGLSETIGQSDSQPGGAAHVSSHLSSHDTSDGYKGGGRKYAQTGDTRLEYMDEEEAFESILRRELQTSFHKMLYVPKVEERYSDDALPREIRFQ